MHSILDSFSSDSNCGSEEVFLRGRATEGHALWPSLFLLGLIASLSQAPGKRPGLPFLRLIWSQHLQQSTHLFTNRIRLLLRENDSSVRLTFLCKRAVQLKEVTDVEAVQYMSVYRGPNQLLQIGRAEHLRL